MQSPRMASTSWCGAIRRSLGSKPAFMHCERPPPPTRSITTPRAVAAWGRSERLGLTGTTLSGAGKSERKGNIMAAGFKRPVANENNHLPPKHDQIAERAQGHRTEHGNSPIPIHGSGGNQNRHEHYAEPQHDAHPVESGRRKTPLAKAKNALKVSVKVTIRVTVSISITITGIGIAANNRHVETAWNSVRNLSYIPGFVAEIVDFAHETSNSAFKFSDAMLHPTLPQRRLPPPAGYPRPIP